MWDVGRSDLTHNEDTLTEADWKRTFSTLWILGSFSFVEVKPYSQTDWFSRKLGEVGEGSRYHHYVSLSRRRNAWGRASAQVSGSCSTALSTLKGTHNFNSSLLVVTFKSHTWKHLSLPYNSGLTKDGLIFFFFLFRDRALYCPSWPEIPMYDPCLIYVILFICVCAHWGQEGPSDSSGIGELWVLGTGSVFLWQNSKCS